jgi:hypothetical protein
MRAAKRPAKENPETTRGQFNIPGSGFCLLGLSFDCGKQFADGRTVGEVGNLQSESNSHGKVQRHRARIKFRSQPDPQEARQSTEVNISEP